ncbi:CMRF35-like molecule 5 isoform X1 [Saccopteryx bilineata]|uniref:CMRF35-like molecule 5 isoform X1 n=2 Tax=Saccopteryx bilineata TaxID=59482 RepID=UPI00338E4E70
MRLMLLFASPDPTRFGRGMTHRGLKMCLPRAFLLLGLPGYFALGVPKILNGTVGGTLVMTCQYHAGGEDHRKFWCRGPDWKGCVRVIETAEVAGQEVRHGRVTLRDNPREHHFLVTMEDLKVGDTDTYWCGVDTGRRFLQAPVTVAVFPGSVTVTARTMEMSTSMGALALTSHVSSSGFSTCRFFLLIASFLFLALLKVVLFLSFAYAAIWLA